MLDNIANTEQKVEQKISETKRYYEQQLLGKKIELQQELVVLDADLREAEEKKVAQAKVEAESEATTMIAIAEKKVLTGVVSDTTISAVVDDLYQQIN